MIEMRGNRVNSSSKVDIMREIEVLDSRKSSCSVKFKYETASITILVSESLDDFFDFGNLFSISLDFQFVGIFCDEFRISFGNFPLVSALTPDLFNDCQHFGVDFPRNRAKIV